MADKKETVETVEATAETKAVETAPAVTYTRDALAGSKKYRPYRDMLMVLLKDDREYTTEEADAIIGQFIKRPVEEEVNE